MLSISFSGRVFLCSLLAAVVAAPVCAQDASLPPSGNFDLSHWRLTLPTGTENAPDVVPPAQLVRGYTSPHFFTGADGAMVFYAPSRGATTKNSDFPRSELREATPDDRPYNWVMGEGTATLSATFAVTQVPGTGKLVVGQVHSTGAKDFQNEPLLMLSYEHHFLFDSFVALTRPTPTDKKTERHVLKRFLWFGMGKKVSYAVTVTPASELVISVNGSERYRSVIDASWKSQKLYFKAGNYLHDDSAAADEGGSVSFYQLTAEHHSP